MTSVFKDGETLNKTPCTYPQPCEMLSRLLVAPGERGLSMPLALNLKTGSTRPFGIVYKLTRRDCGIMLNACPFCRKSLSWTKKK